MAKLEHYLAQRNAIDIKLKRIDDFINSFDATKQSKNQLNARIEILNDARKDFDQLQYEIEQADKITTVEEHMNKRGEFEDKYCDLVSKIKDILDNSANIAQNPSRASNVPATTQSNASLFNLPVINLNTFSGNFKEWLDFSNNFKSVIDENKALNNRQRLQYLKSCLRGDALRAVNSLTIDENNYEKAWNILEKRFKNTRLIVQDYIFSIINAPPLTKSSAVMLRELLDNITANTASLKTLNIEIDTWHALIVPIISEKLDFITKREWQSSLETEVPTYQQLIKFLEKRCLLLESLNTTPLTSNKSASTSNSNVATKTQNHNTFKARTVSYASTENKRYLCLFCKNTTHNISQCDKFLKLNSAARLNEAQCLKLCVNCLRNNHLVTSCRSNSKCRTCNKQHHTLLHSDNEPTINSVATIEPQPARTNSVLLSTAVILIKNSKNEYRLCRAFLDQGSMSNYITEAMVKELNLKSIPTHVEIRGLNGTISETNKQASVNIKSKYNSFSANINCFIVNKITKNLPLVQLERVCSEIPHNLSLADPEFYIPNKIDLLIGAKLFWDLLCIGQVKIPSGLVLQKTHFGFIAGGPYNNNGNLQQTSCNTGITRNSILEKQLQRFFEQDNISNGHNTVKFLTEEEKDCEKHLKNNISRDPDGRFIVKLPLKNNKLELGETKSLALKLFYNTERKLNNNPELKKEYSKFIAEYLNLDHMKPVTESFKENNTPHSYLPHHAVFKETSTTTKLRVVFDASLISKNGLSLNDNLMRGPVIQSDLFTIVIRFRLHQYALNADIAKMYRQIKVFPDDANLQLIFWRDQSNEPVKTFKLTTLTYGTKPASFLATRCLKQLADENEINSPRACEIIRTEFYMDDLLTGADSISELYDIKNQITDILRQGGFELRKFRSNYKDCCMPDDYDNNYHDISLCDNECSKVLGLYWNSSIDTLKFKIQINSIPSKITKRNILSTMAQIFDPLGLIGPIIMKAKIILQQLWAIKLAWDESVPSHIHTIWKSFLDQLRNVENFHFPRKIIPFNYAKPVEIHGFCDASMQGYGAAIYIRAMNSAGVFETRLLCSKSRVAPLKTITLPRLELCGAVLLAQLIEKTRQANLNISREFLWTDSSIVLAWINSPPASLMIFIANRVSEIIKITNTNSWRHIRSENNAADILSRGALPSELKNYNTWFTGPDFLRTDESFWPQSVINKNIQVPETRVNMHTIVKQCTLDISKFSKFAKLQRVYAWVLRFIYNCKHKKNNKLTDLLSVQELENSTTILVRLIQKNEFINDLKNLKENKPLHKSSKLLPLDPFIDESGLIRVGRRLKNATNLVGANNALKELSDFIKNDEVEYAIKNEMSKFSIIWHFIPPKSPHMGGLWESCVKSIKNHMKKTVGNANLTFSEMQTFLIRVEACLNSRPLTPLSPDPSDLEPLTPGHFLIGQPLTEIPERDVSSIKLNRLSRWQLVERLRAHFWKRWSREYLTQLQSRAKWRANAATPLQVGDMVILIEDNIPLLCWRIGRVVEIHPGEDKNVRVATVLTKQGTFKRATQNLCVLPLEKGDSEVQ